jgi:HK97 family phage portal protein
MARRKKRDRQTHPVNGNGTPVATLAPDAQPPNPGENGTTRIIWIPERQAGVRVNEETALTVGAVFACVRVITEDIAGLPWRVKERRSGGGSDDRPDDPADWLLHFQANPETPAFQWREVMLAWALTWGNGFAEVERDFQGRPFWLWQLTPDRVEVARFQGRIIYDVANPRSPNTVLEADDVFHLRGLGFDGLVGYSVIRLAARTLGMAMAMEESGSTLFANDSTPGGVLTHPGKLSDPARDRLAKDWQHRHGGPTRRRTIAILEEGMKWEQTALPPEDVQFLEQRSLTPSEVARWFRVKPHKIADLSRSNFANIEDENSTHVSDTLLPWGRRLEAEANVKLFGRTNRGRRFTKLNFLGLLRGDTPARTAYYQSLLDRGVFSVNDVLELEDRNPIGPDGDKRFVPLNMQLLKRAGEEPPAPETPPAETPPDDPDEGEETPFPPETMAVRVRAAFLTVATDTFARLLRREAGWAEEKVMKPHLTPETIEYRLTNYVTDYLDYVLANLRAPAGGYAQATGADPAKLEPVLVTLASDHIAAFRERIGRASTQEWQSLAPTLAEVFMDRITAALEASK